MMMNKKGEKGINMEIKIKAQDMLYVLIEAGLDETDAKAIIFDLLSIPEGGLPSKSTKSKKVIKINKHMEDDEEDDEENNEDKDIKEEKEDEEDEEEDEDDEDDDDARDKIKIPKTKIHKHKPKRINFSAFGGPAEPVFTSRKQ